MLSFEKIVFVESLAPLSIVPDFFSMDIPSIIHRCQIETAGLKANRMESLSSIPRRLGVLFVLAASLSLLFPTSAFAQLKPTINQLKVDWIYNFSQRVEWDKKAFATDESPFVIGVLGDAPMGALLNIVARKKKAQGRRIVANRIRAGDDYTTVHLLFVSDTIGAVERRNIIAKTKRKHVMVVGEIPGFATQGACVNFYVDAQRRVLFELNTDTSKRQKLKFSHDLTKIAKSVRDSDSGRNNKP